MDNVIIAQFVQRSRDNQKRLDWNAVLNFLNINPDINVMSNQSINFKLSGFDYINVDGLFWLLLAADNLRKHENYLWLELPDDSGQLSVIKSSNFYDIAKELFSISDSYKLEKIDLSTKRGAYRFYKVDINSLNELHKELGGNVIQLIEFAHRIKKKLSDDIIFEGLPFLRLAINEINKNIVQHSNTDQDKCYGYFVQSEHQKSKLQICVGDTGIGLRKSFEKKGVATKDDFEALEHALLYRYFNAEGEGLFRAIQALSCVQGVFRIRSGNAEGFLDLTTQILRDDIDTKKFVEEKLRKTRTNLFFPGVQYLIDINKLMIK